MLPGRSLPSGKTPTPHRILCALLLTASPAVGAPLTETDVVRLAQQQSRAAVVAANAVRVAEAQRVGAGLYPNPQIGWNRAYVPELAGEQEDALVLDVPIDLSSRRGMAARLADSNVAQAQANAARARGDAVAEALLAYYAVLAGQERVLIQTRQRDQAQEAARVMARRREQGRASGYEAARLTVELELLTSALNQTQADTARTRGSLAALLGLEPPDALELAGTLAPNEALAQADASRSDLEHLRQAEAHGRAAADRAALAWVPTVTLSGGAKVQDGRYGYVAGASLGLPLFSRGQDLAAQGRAQAQVAHDNHAATARQAQADQAAALTLLHAMRVEAQRFAAQTGAAVAVLERAAQSGYQEGQTSLLDLLDAQRASAQVALRRLELAWAIKRAEVALRQARGDFQ